MVTDDVHELLKAGSLDLSSMDRARLEAVCNALLRALLEVYSVLEEETGQAALLKEQADAIGLLSRQVEGLSRASTRLAQRATVDDAVRAAEAERLDKEREALAYEAALVDTLHACEEFLTGDAGDAAASDGRPLARAMISSIEEVLGLSGTDEPDDDDLLVGHLPYCSYPDPVDPRDCPICSSIPPERRQEIIDTWEARSAGIQGAGGLDGPPARKAGSGVATSLDGEAASRTPEGEAPDRDPHEPQRGLVQPTTGVSRDEPQRGLVQPTTGVSRDEPQRGLVQPTTGVSRDEAGREDDVGIEP